MGPLRAPGKLDDLHIALLHGSEELAESRILVGNTRMADITSFRSTWKPESVALTFMSYVPNGDSIVVGRGAVRALKPRGDRMSTTC